MAIMKQQIHAGWRIAIVTLLHLLLARFAYEWWVFGPHYGPHGSIPGHDLLFEGSASAICLVLLVPVFLRGNISQRTAVIVLSLLPVTLFLVVVYYVVHVCIYIYG
jgi:hypothetical protein